MGSIIDRIQELAQDMGVFTTRQMAFRVYGNATNTAISSTGGKLRTLERQGYLRKVGIIHDDGGNSMMTWEAVR